MYNDPKMSQSLTEGHMTMAVPRLIHNPLASTSSGFIHSRDVEVAIILNGSRDLGHVLFSGKFFIGRKK